MAPSSTHGHRVPVPLPAVRAPQLGAPAPATEGSSGARRAPPSQDPGRLARGCGRGAPRRRAPGALFPGHRLPRGARGLRGRAQVSANNAEQSPRRGPAHDTPRARLARDTDGWGPAGCTSWDTQRVTGASSLAARRARGAWAPTPRDRRGELAAGPGARGSGQGALQARKRGAGGGSHVGHLRCSARGGGERGAGGALGAPGRPAPHRFSRPKHGAVGRKPGTHSCAGSQPLSAAVLGTVPSAGDAAGCIAPTHAKMLALAPFLFVMAIVPSLQWRGSERDFWPGSPLKSRRCLLFKNRSPQSKTAHLAQCLESKHSINYGYPCTICSFQTHQQSVIV